MPLRALLWQEIEQEKNYLGQGYISAPSLQSLVTIDAVRGCLLGRGITLKIDIASAVVLKAPALFAALVLMEREHLIEWFLQENFHDKLMPAEEKDLPAFETTEDTKRFLEIQRLLPPIFSQDNIFKFSPKSILPFVSLNGPQNSGAFGQIFKVRIRQGHILNCSTDLWCAQKRIPKFEDDSWDNLAREITTLRKRQHPGIISLLGCFIVDGDESSSYVRSLNLIFPWVDMNFEEWMNLDHTPSYLAKMDIVNLRAFIYDRIYSLAAALAYIHRDIDHEIASHHDLKPENILVKENIFYICDFGLSRLWEVAEGSGTQGRLGLGSFTYRPPEYWRTDGERNQIKHGRAFDVWALGCIFLELLTILVYGWGGGILRRFESKRQHSTPRINFKDGDGNAKAEASYHNHMNAVQEWVSELRQYDNSSRVNQMLEIVMGMLQDDRKERLLSWEIQLDLFDMLHPDMPNKHREEQGLRIIQSPPVNQSLTSSPLLRAVSRGDAIRVQLLLNAGWSSCVTDSRGLYPVRMVPETAYKVLRKLQEQLFLNTQIDLSQGSSSGTSQTQELMLGSSSGKFHHTTNGAISLKTSNSDREWYQRLYPGGINAPLIISSGTRSRLHVAAIHADEQAIIDQPEILKDLYTADQNGKTPLHYASQLATGDMVAMMLMKARFPRDLLEARDLNGDTPLHCAVYAGNERTVKVLLQSGLCGRVLPMMNDDAKTPLRLAESHRHTSIAAWLKEQWTPVNSSSQN